VKRTGSDDTLRCSFAIRVQDVVGKLISSPSDYPLPISARVHCRLQFIFSRTIRPISPPRRPHKLPKPLEVKDTWTNTSSGRDGTKKKLAVAVYNHCKRIHMNKLRSTDVELSKSTFFSSALPARQDADGPNPGEDFWTCLSLSWMQHPDRGRLRGRGLENIILKLLQAADGDVQRCQQGIIYIDEIDKICRRTRTLRSPGTSRARDGSTALLKILDGTTANVPPQGGRKHPPRSSPRWTPTNIPVHLWGRFRRSRKGSATESRRQKSMGFPARRGTKSGGRRRGKATGDERQGGISAPIGNRYTCRSD